MAQSLDTNKVQCGLQPFYFYDVMIVSVGRACLFACMFARLGKVWGKNCIMVEALHQGDRSGRSGSWQVDFRYWVSPGPTTYKKHFRAIRVGRGCPAE